MAQEPTPLSDVDLEQSDSPCPSAEPARVEVIQGTIARDEIDLAAFTGYLHSAIAATGRWVRRLAVRIVDDAEMTRLHRLYKQEEGPTDVLTFAQSERDDPIDADIAVNFDEARRRGKEFGHGVDRELLLYALHGILHCCGYDDHDAASFAAMHAEEDRVLTAIGMGPLFRAGGAASEGEAE